jgi:hypothetical protein
MDARVETWAKIDTGGKKFEFHIILLVFQSNYPTNVGSLGNDQEVEFHEIKIHFFMRSNS